jgi:hypothetical protein
VIDRIKQESFMTENVCIPVTSAARKLHAAGRATGVREDRGVQSPAAIGASGRTRGWDLGKNTERYTESAKKMNMN